MMPEPGQETVLPRRESQGGKLWFFAGLLLLALAVGFVTDLTRVHRAQAGDLQTLQILTEDYHWVFVVRPDRVDTEIWEFFKAGAIMYPIMPLVYVPHMAVQLLIPGAGNAQFVFSLSLYLTLLLLTGLFFVGLKKGLSAAASFLITSAVLVNPFLLYLLASAPVIPSVALVPLAYLMYLSRRKWAALALFLVIALSYRFGSFFLFLLVLGTRPHRDQEDDGLFKLSLASLGALMVIQTSSQFLLVHFNDYVRELEGLRVGYTFGMFKRFVTTPLAPDVLFREFQVAAWLAAGGFALLLRPWTRWGLLMLGGVLAYLTWVTGPFSLSVVLATAIAGIALVNAAHHWSRRTGDGRTRRRRETWLASTGLAGALAVGLLAPVFPAPVSLAESPAQADEKVEVTTLAGFYRQAVALPLDPHLEGAAQLLGEVPQAQCCLVDPLLMAAIPASVCRQIVPLGKSSPREGPLIDRAILDESAKAAAFRDALIHDLRVSELWIARFDAARDAVRTSGRFGVRLAWDGLVILDLQPYGQHSSGGGSP